MQATPAPVPSHHAARRARSHTAASIAILAVMTVPTAALMLNAPDWMKVVQIVLMLLCWAWASMTRPPTGEEAR